LPGGEKEGNEITGKKKASDKKGREKYERGSDRGRGKKNRLLDGTGGGKKKTIFLPGSKKGKGGGPDTERSRGG